MQKLTVLLDHFVDVLWQIVIFFRSTETIKFGTATDSNGNVGDVTWTVESQKTPIHPGPNRFSNYRGDVWLESSTNSVHLTITKHGTRWWCTSLTTDLPLHYGTYTWTVETLHADDNTDLAKLDENAVFGLFSYLTDYHEIDFEVISNTVNSNHNAQFVVQPLKSQLLPGDEVDDDWIGHFQFSGNATSQVATIQYKWQADQVNCKSWAGPVPSGPVQYEWNYPIATRPEQVVPASPMRVNMNLYLRPWPGQDPERSQDPALATHIHVVVTRFTFVAE